MQAQKVTPSNVSSMAANEHRPQAKASDTVETLKLSGPTERIQEEHTVTREMIQALLQEQLDTLRQQRQQDMAAIRQEIATLREMMIKAYPSVGHHGTMCTDRYQQVKSDEYKVQISALKAQRVLLQQSVSKYEKQEQSRLQKENDSLREQVAACHTRKENTSLVLEPCKEYDSW
jgi:hypothetical protein